MIYNYSEKIMKLGFPKEIRDAFEHALNVALTDKGLDFPLTLSDSVEVNAYAGPRGIEICQGLIEELHRKILINGTFNIAVDGIKKRYDVSDDTFHIREIILNLAILICFYHEFGHIINGHIDFIPDESLRIFAETPQNLKEVDGYVEDSILEYDADAYAGKSIAGVVYNNLIFECPENVRPIVEGQLIQLASFAFYYVLNCEGSDENVFDYPPYLWRMYTVSRIAMEGLRELREHGKFLDTQMNVALEDINTEDFKHLKNDISKIIEINKHSWIDVFSGKKMQPWVDYYNAHKGILVNVYKCIADPSNSIFYKKSS